MVDGLKFNNLWGIGQPNVNGVVPTDTPDIPIDEQQQIERTKQVLKKLKSNMEQKLAELYQLYQKLGLYFNPAQYTETISLIANAIGNNSISLSDLQAIQEHAETAFAELEQEVNDKNQQITDKALRESEANSTIQIRAQNLADKAISVEQRTEFTQIAENLKEQLVSGEITLEEFHTAINEAYQKIINEAPDVDTRRKQHADEVFNYLVKTLQQLNNNEIAFYYKDHESPSDRFRAATADIIEQYINGEIFIREFDGKMQTIAMDLKKELADEKYGSMSPEDRKNEIATTENNIKKLENEIKEKHKKLKEMFKKLGIPFDSNKYTSVEEFSQLFRDGYSVFEEKPVNPCCVGIGQIATPEYLASAERLDFLKGLEQKGKNILEDINRYLTEALNRDEGRVVTGGASVNQGEKAEDATAKFLNDLKENAGNRSMKYVTNILDSMGISYVTGTETVIAEYNGEKIEIKTTGDDPTMRAKEWTTLEDIDELVNSAEALTLGDITSVLNRLYHSFVGSAPQYDIRDNKVVFNFGDKTYEIEFSQELTDLVNKESQIGNVEDITATLDKLGIDYVVNNNKVVFEHRNSFHTILIITQEELDKIRNSIPDAINTFHRPLG